jgi:formate dehydrogenase subunit gamma
MSVQLKGIGSVVQIRWIPKYTFVERLLHWVHTASFVPLALTGLVLYFPPLQPLAQGDAGLWVRAVHRIVAVVFMAEPLLYAILQPRRLWMSLKEFSFDRDDLGWIRNAFGYYVLGRHGAMPPQGRFNTGEKMNGLIMVASWALFTITDLIMWFGKGFLPTWLYQPTVVVHDLAMIAAVCMFLVHLYLAVAHPLMWAGLVSMRFGVTSADYAAEHHARWYYGPRRARQLYEAQKKAAAESKQRDEAKE